MNTIDATAVALVGVPVAAALVAVVCAALRGLRQLDIPVGKAASL